MRDRSDDLVAEIFDRISTLERARDAQSTLTLNGLRPLISSLVEYGAVAIERDERLCPDPPAAAIEHARNAAWAGVSLADLNRGYIAARTVFNKFLRGEARSVEGYEDDTLSQIYESNDIVFERLSSRVARELEREGEKKRRSQATHQLERVKALLAGELIAAPDLEYAFDATHIGIVASGEGLDTHIRTVARSVGGMSLLVHPSPQKVWAWISIQHLTSPSRLHNQLLNASHPAALVAAGEPAFGIAGWRQTHEQASAAFGALGPNKARVRYPQVALIASIAKDTLLRRFLIEAYLAPLKRQRPDGTLEDTLEAYLLCGRNISSAAAQLRIAPRTLRGRLGLIERLLDKPISAHMVELDAALRLRHWPPHAQDG